ncbi:anaerobic selenocysteine-containing dehydrogenase [Dongia mobilis]|uniref:Anaerobic selenocysteine-containing dehydrogenase n=1 Tax=Dongia mobilis TaxID=578943 RepID=A0A4R6WU68_9PROT|nr:molybdopterin-dependent oxidoreductase [Dongia mobilis]TDQ80458.1 anaerobic selenocysteine-containing dehydrogenase [Dongia mobilis]
MTDSHTARDDQGREIIRTTCPRDCYDACGIAVVKASGGRIKVLGDPDHAVSRGALCGKCAIAYNGAYLDPKARLTQPLRRTGPKGSGQYQAVSWESAISEIADRLRGIVAKSGPEAIWHTHYTGTCSAIAGGFPQRFFHRLCASEVDPDSICNAAGHAALGYLIGTGSDGFDPRMAEQADCIMVWGANPSASAPHRHKHWLKETKAKVIVVDPVRHETAAEADLHLQPFPGSDAALAFGLLHVLVKEKLTDDAFIRDHTIGWDEIAGTIAAATPARTAALTGVPEADIIEAARLYGSGPALLWLGQGLQRQPMGGNIFRAIGLLPAATGNFGKPGAGLLFLNGGARRGIDGDYLEAPHLRSNERQVASHMDLVDLLNDRSRAQALVTWNINIAASNPRQADLRAVLQSEDLFHVAIDLFPTDTVDLADIILPAASFLEFDDIVMSYFDLTISAQAKAMEPMGEALPNQEIFRRLAAAMGYDEPELFERDNAILDNLARQLGERDFAALKAAGTKPRWVEPVVQFPDLVFPTPSGRIEIASERAAADGLPRVPHAEVDAHPAAGRLRLLSPASKWLMNSSYHNDPKIAAKLGPEHVVLHPDDAAARGIAGGSQIRVSNATGSITMIADIADTIPRGVALAAKSRWPKLVPGGLTVNALNPGQKADMAESSSVHGVEVEVAPLLF